MRAKCSKFCAKILTKILTILEFFFYVSYFRPFWSPTVLYLEHGADGLQFFVVEILKDEGCHCRDDPDKEVGTRQRHEGRARGE